MHKVDLDKETGERLIETATVNADINKIVDGSTIKKFIEMYSRKKEMDTVFQKAERKHFIRNN